jgi:hypothetical protein
MPTRVNNKNPISCAHREPHQLDNHKLVEQIDHDYHVDNSSSVGRYELGADDKQLWGVRMRACVLINYSSLD